MQPVSAANRPAKPTTKSLLAHCWGSSSKLFIPVLKRVGTTIFWWALLLRVLDQCCLRLTKVDDGSSYLLGTIGSIFVTGLIWPTVFIMITPVAANDIVSQNPQTNLIANFKKYINPITIESLRVLGKCLLWAVVFIVPGIVKMVQYYFVPYVVQFSKRYDRNEVDALQYSSQVLRVNWVAALIVGISFLPLGMVPQYFLGKIELSKTPASFVVLALVELAGEVFADIGIYSLYERMQSRFEEGRT